MAELFVSPFVGKLMEKVMDGLFYYVQDQFKWQTGMKKELERLRDDYFPKITAVVSAARRAQTKDQNTALNKWIWKLRDAIDEADDLFDDFEYMKHQQQGNWQKLIQVGERALNTDPMLKRLEEVVQKLDNISAEVSTFLHILKDINQEQREQHDELHKSRETGSSPKDDLIGRGQDKKSVIEWLRKPSDVTTNALHSNISLLSIVGHGGMGKTTLLQHVYADEMTKEFDLKMWVCVSDNFDVKKVITDMLECLQNKRPSLESLHALQNSLQSEVISKKFLLVLDDIWDDKEEEAALGDKWRNVLSPLAYGGLGSKVLITTRTDSAASMIAKVIRKQKEVMKLEGLKEDECLKLLNTHAFSVGENPDDHKKLKSIAEELVKKLYGSPLAAKVMGGVLNSNLDERHWRCVLNNSLGQNDIFSILKLSYIFLPEHLQSCFSYCSIFEQDHLFDKNDLIRLWIAVGFIQPSDSNPGEDLSVEDIGERYFGVLIKKSFFDEVFYTDGPSRGYMMHDLLHELAQSVSTQECFRFVGNKKSKLLAIPETIRHLSVNTRNPEVLKTVERFKNLRTLRITYEYDSNLVDTLVEIFQVTRRIRSLNINSWLKEIPEEIKYLQHLRYLSFFSSIVKLLPRSLSTLYHLQFIILDKNILLNFPNGYFPRDMNKLSNLRFFSGYCLNFPGIGKLKFLQVLHPFNIKNKNGYKIEELEHTNEIRILHIYNLKDVRDAQEACNAKLCDKRKLTDLHLNWDERFISRIVDDIGGLDLEERVLDNLQPHKYLKTLWIYNYIGVRSAIWMNEAHLINNLQEIILWRCLEWEILPPFGQLPFLKSLTLSEMPKVKRIENKFHGDDMCCVFPSLQKLHFGNLEALVDWFDASVVDGLFPCLTELYLSDCPNLQELPYLPPKLKKLQIDKIGWKTLNYCSISKFVSLKTLFVYNCDYITSISTCVFSSLEELHFKNLKALVDWFDPNIVEGLFPCLTKLELSDCPNLQELPYLPPKLESLSIHHMGWKTVNCCNISKSIPLKRLDVHHFPNITSISLCVFPALETLFFEKLEALVDWFDASVVDNLFPCLTELELYNCPNLQELPYLPPKLKLLKIENIGWKTLNSCSISKSIPLSSLEVRNCQNLEALVDWFDASVVDGFFPCLTHICLVNCPNLQELPYLPPKLKLLKIENIGWKVLNCCSISKSIPLETLYVRHCPNITSISPCVFPSLEELHFENLEALVDWFDASVVDYLFPCLTKLYISNCLNLQEFPCLPPKLKTLQIDKIGWKTLNCCSISKSIPLQTLEVRHCPNITSISLEGEIGTLKRLTIEDLPSLQYLPSSLENVRSLEFLKLAELPQLQDYPDLPPSLKEMYIR